MRIAIYEPEPMVCGPMVWAGYLQAGFRSLGHECDVITFTRSGKSRAIWNDPETSHGLRWRDVPPDEVGRYSTATDLLQQYDGVILNDARTVMHDRSAQAGTSYLHAHTPDYLSVLAVGQVPFTFALHGNAYPVKELPFAERLMALPGFTGTAVSHSPLAVKQGAPTWRHRVSFVITPLPFVPQFTIDDDLPDNIGDLPVGITGRYTSTKGHHALAWAAAYDLLPQGVNVELWGSCLINRAPSLSFNTFEQLTKAGLIGARADAHVTAPAIWSVGSPDGTDISYKGGYRDGRLVAQELSAHVDLTSSRFSAGAMEFSQLEAIDAGRAQVSVDSMWDPQFIGETIPAVHVWPGDGRFRTDESTRQLLHNIGGAVSTVLAIDPDTRRQNAVANRITLARVHDPKITARIYLKALMLA